MGQEDRSGIVGRVLNTVSQIECVVKNYDDDYIPKPAKGILVGRAFGKRQLRIRSTALSLLVE